MTSMDSTDYIKLSAFQELKDALQVKRVNDELLEYLSSYVGYFIIRIYIKYHYQKKIKFWKHYEIL
ncbi:MAG: hypothetical protein ACXWFC_05635 [Nitrososphaeraceae archaeon]